MIKYPGRMDQKDCLCIVLAIPQCQVLANSNKPSNDSTLPSTVRVLMYLMTKFLQPVAKLSGGMLSWLSGMRCRLACSPADATATHYQIGF